MPVVSVEEKKAWLSRGKTVKAELQLLNDTRRCVYEDATHITGKISAGKVKNSCNVHRFDKLAEIEDFIIQKEKELCSTRCEIIKAIYTVPTWTGRQILIYKYIYGLTVPNIAEKLSYCEKHINRLQAKAIEEIKISV